ncbi:serine protease [Staphylococcus casei]|uniref:trypsin-like serine peptidase n=1 Tax=Staphylococcus TaxID=1279 RepID=UPI000CD31BC2|nr:serine protease [Staphylococcus casei]PNZ60075.1 serine protease [Staphylococcus casei]WJE86710.1 serine protease [Staphylococcus casei]
MFLRKLISSVTLSLALLLTLASGSHFANADVENNEVSKQPAQSTEVQQDDNKTNQPSNVSQKVILPNEDRHQIENTQSGHYQSVGFINLGQNIATGVVIDKNTVLTNKHVANLSDGNMTFAPAAQDENHFPYGTFAEKDVQPYPGSADLVLVHFKENNKGQSVGDVVQPATLQDASTVSKDDPVTITGYPGDKPLATMWESSGEIIGNQGTELTYDASTYGGNSGSPVFNENNQVIGLHHGGIEGESNNAVAITGDVLDFINNNKE